MTLWLDWRTLTPKPRMMTWLMRIWWRREAKEVNSRPRPRAREPRKAHRRGE